MKLTNYTDPKIYKGNEWYVWFRYKHPTTGKWILYKKKTGLNSADTDKRVRLLDARAMCAALLERLKAGWTPAGDSQPQEYDQLKFTPAVEVIRKLLDIKKGSVKHRTLQAYAYSVNIFEKWLKKEDLHTLMLESITPVLMTQFFDSLRMSGKYKNRSINNHAAFLKILFNDAIDRELITKNPLKKYRDLPEEEGKNFPYSEKQKKKLKEYMLANDPEMWLFVKCVYHLFVRPIELLQIRISDIDFRTKQIVIHSERGKNKKQLGISIPDSFMQELKTLKLHSYPEHYYLFGWSLKPSDKKYSRNAVSARYKTIKDALGMDDSNFTLYSWKHTGNVDSFLAGVDIFDLMRQNRHHSISQTETYLRSMGLRPNIGYSAKAPSL